MFAMDEPARLFGGELGDAIDVARREGTEILVHPPRALRARPRAHIVAHHQRRRRGEEKAVVARRDGGFDQVKRAARVDVDEGLARITDDVGLVQCACVNHRLDAMLAHRPVDESAVGDGAEQLRMRAGHDVESDDLMPRSGE